jgi:hypothetical protein
MAKQQFENTFESNSNGMKKKYQVLLKHLGLSHVINSNNSQPDIVQKQDSSNHQKKKRKSDAMVRESTQSRYTEIKRLLDSGLSAKEISSQVEVPYGEIELIKNLQKIIDKPNATNRKNFEIDRNLTSEPIGDLKFNPAGLLEGVVLKCIDDRQVKIRLSKARSLVKGWSGFKPGDKVLLAG